jgi:hypothetical protein
MALFALKKEAVLYYISHSTARGKKLIFFFSPDALSIEVVAGEAYFIRNLLQLQAIYPTMYIISAEKVPYPSYGTAKTLRQCRQAK